MPDGLLNMIIYVLTYTDFHESFLINAFMAGFATSLICMAISLIIAAPGTIILKIISSLGAYFMPETLWGAIITTAATLAMVAIAITWLALLICTLVYHGFLSIIFYVGCNLGFSWMIYHIWYDIFGFKPRLPY